MAAPHPPPGAPASMSGSVPRPPGSFRLPVPPSCLTSFLPLTLTAIRERPGLGTLGHHAVAAELAAGDSWQALLGDCTWVRRRQFPTELRRLSDAASEATGNEWWGGRGSAHRNRVHESERWVSEALDDGDGAEFATACAHYDAALAHALVTAQAPG